MNLLEECLKQNISFNEILNLVVTNDKKYSLDLLGLTDIAKAQMVHSLTKNTNKSSIVICSNVVECQKMMQDLKFLSDVEVIYFPARNIEYYDIEAESKEVINQRMYAIEKILSKKINIVVTTIDAILVKMFPFNSYGDLDVEIKIGDLLQTNDFVKTLIKLGYERCKLVEGKGQFALRGGIIDIFTLNSEFPFRIELFGNNVDTIRTFDSLTQRSSDTLKKVKISYVSENNLSSESIKTCLIKLTQLVDKNDISIELKRNILDDIEKIKQGKDTNIFDKYFALLVDKYESLLDYVEDYTIFLSEENRCIEKAHNIFYENSETIKNLAQRNHLYIPYVNRYFSFDEIEPRINKSINIHMQTLALDKAQTKGKKYVFDLKEKYSYKNDLDILVKDIKSANDKTVLLVLPTKNRAEQIKNYLLENSIKSEFIESINDNFIKGHVYITNGIISGGYESSELNLLLIAEAVCGVNLNKLKKKKQDSIGQNINSYDDLEIGDYVVHENHGIGIYKGINTINVLEFQKDYIKIEYANLDSLYVPINQLDLVKKYVCDDDTKPKINALGTKEWQKIKRKVSEHVKEMAKELIQLYAKREELRGYAFPKDSPWQKEFEDAFDYELTADQKTSVEEVKADMEDIKPMDRLLCGDVGYGKTEVALRAAFKAAIAGKQVAYMVPTTVLSLQQYRTFNERMQDFGIRVEMLSRFKTKVEQNKIIKNMTDGTIDIVVGTHRLLSKDVFFKDLGLLIIDEEHRFGVKAKETIKQLKDSVDVLSMTATPIPRTLHMSMIGIRQMSTLTEPPMERLPVHTYVLEYDENVVQAAIEKELLRDGQVFYINNRVDNIADVTDKVQKLVPHAKVAFAHGQMEPDDIENIMIKVIEHEIDVLVCTTILESGIDIQNANTIIIENADKLGLAQLYQIRGRVGRSSRLAYAYITYPKNKVLSEVSEKRLKAIKDFTEFGSGFKIALRDLEIRGAGNLLGRQQHGHMAKVGYEMYLTLLQRAVKTEKDGKLQDFQEVVAKEIKIELDVSAYISDSYISDPVQKIFMYQRISQINTEDEMMDVIDELLDRYGALPKATENLIKIVEIRNKARKLGITKIVGTNNFIKFEPSLLKIQLTNNYNNDILLRVQLEIEKMLKNNEKG